MPCGQQRDQRAGHREQIARRYGDQAEIGREANQRAENKADESAGHHAEAGAALRCGDAIKEQHDFGAFAQHRDRNHDASAVSDFEPAATASPAARNSAAISRPCRAIQTLCQVSIMHGEAENGGVEHSPGRCRRTVQTSRR
jgi:hypothetical protein